MNRSRTAQSALYRGRAVRPRRTHVAAIALGAAACVDIPTSAPRLDLTFGINGAADSITVAGFLPSAVRLGRSGGAGVFWAVTPPMTSLVEVPIPCAPKSGGGCAPLVGSVRMPTIQIEASGTLDPSIVRTTLLAGQSLRFSLRHTLPVDPLGGPSASLSGTLTVQLFRDEELVSVVRLVGRDINATQGSIWEANSPLLVALPLVAGDNLAGELTLRVRLEGAIYDGPINVAQPNAEVRIDQVSDSLAFVAASVAPGPKITTARGSSLDLSALADRDPALLGTATVRLVVDNPLQVRGSGQLRFQFKNQPAAAAVMPAKPIVLKSATNTGPVRDTIVVQLTADEVRFLAKIPSTLVAQLTMTPTGRDGIVDLRPESVLRITPQIVLTLRPFTP